jgi:hypothetical protein
MYYSKIQTLLIRPRALLFISCIVIIGNIGAQTIVWQPPSGHTQVTIWPKTILDLQPMTGSEFMHQSENLIANKPCMLVERVSLPTMIIFSPTVKNTRAAVVVFPGGVYKCLAIDLEGTEICEWLASIGITGIPLKYRVPYSGPYWDSQSKIQKDPEAPMALEDA